MIRYLPTTLALTAQLIAAGPVLAAGSMPAAAMPALAASAMPAAAPARSAPSSSTSMAAPKPVHVRALVGVVGEGWG